MHGRKLLEWGSVGACVWVEGVMVTSEVLVKLAHLLIPRNQAQEVGGRQGEGPTEEDAREVTRGLLSFDRKELVFFFSWGFRMWLFHRMYHLTHN